MASAAAVSGGISARVGGRLFHNGGALWRTRAQWAASDAARGLRATTRARAVEDPRVMSPHITDEEEECGVVCGVLDLWREDITAMPPMGEEGRRASPADGAAAASLEDSRRTVAALEAIERRAVGAMSPGAAAADRAEVEQLIEELRRKLRASSANGASSTSEARSNDIGGGGKAVLNSKVSRTLSALSTLAVAVRDGGGISAHKAMAAAAFKPTERDFWFPVAFSADVGPTTLLAFDLFNVPWVVFRESNGGAGCIKDECAHRACPLSLGKNIAGRVQCPYHGWEYSAAGDCLKMPSCHHLPGVRVDALPVCEQHGLIFAWAGPSTPTAPSEVLSHLAPPKGFTPMAELTVEVPLEHAVVVDRLLDLTKRSAALDPVKMARSASGRGGKMKMMPSLSNFDFDLDVEKWAARLLRGSWVPVPSGVEFVPSCVLTSTLNLRAQNQARKGDGDRNVHQVHACLPSKPGHTRLLYRMSFDFLPAGADAAVTKVWRLLAEQILREELEDVRDDALFTAAAATAAASLLELRQSFDEGDEK